MEKVDASCAKVGGAELLDNNKPKKGSKLKTDAEKLAQIRAGIVRCERRIKRTVTALKKYRRREAYYLRKQSAEVAASLKPLKQPKRKLYL